MSIFNSRIFLALNARGNTFQVLEIPNQVAKDIHINAGAIMPGGFTKLILHSRFQGKLGTFIMRKTLIILSRFTINI